MGVETADEDLVCALFQTPFGILQADSFRSAVDQAPFRGRNATMTGRVVAATQLKMVLGEGVTLVV